MSSGMSLESEITEWLVRLIEDEKLHRRFHRIEQKNKRNSGLRL